MASKISCSKCGQSLDNKQIVDNFVYDIKGVLKYIELAHLKCKPEWKKENRLCKQSI
jgi:hypothetical protein